MRKKRNPEIEAVIERMEASVYADANPVWAVYRLADDMEPDARQRWVREVSKARKHLETALLFGTEKSSE
jgi:hypothetical protein